MVVCVYRVIVGVVVNLVNIYGVRVVVVVFVFRGLIRGIVVIVFVGVVGFLVDVIYGYLLWLNEIFVFWLVFI